MAKRTIRKPDGAAVGEIGVHDPFNLVRHLARSQSDARKAIAELVQNALDEQATQVQIERRKTGREVLISILDNGRGVLPHLPRAEALETIAKSIGQSRKRQMSFDQRMHAAMLGQYGIGLLGFWSVGHQMRMISRVNGSETWCLTLWEDSPKFEVDRWPEEIGQQHSTFTEIQVVRVHASAMTATSSTKLQTYLSVELRGQLIRHGTELTIVDRLARNPAERNLQVKPVHLAGERLEGISSIAIDGYTYPVDLQLYYAGDFNIDEAPTLRLSSAGAVLIDNVTEHTSLAFAPYNDRRLAGIIDFPHLEVPPGTRRGFVANEAAHAMIQALERVGPQVQAKLAEKEALEASRVSLGAQKQLAKLFSKATSFVPHLEWFDVGRRKTTVDTASTAGENVVGQAGELAESSALEDAEGGASQNEIFPPGPAVRAQLVPSQAKVQTGQLRRFQVIAFDADARRTPVSDWHFHCEGAAALLPSGSISSNACVIQAAAHEGLSTLTASSQHGETPLTAQATIEVREQWNTHPQDSGIPTPEEANEPQSTWRSRWLDGRWTVNVGHADFQALGSEPKLRVQYLAYLLAKEVICRNFPRPELGSILEEMVGLLAALERARMRGRT